MSWGASIAGLALVLVAYVLPADRVVHQVAKVRERQAPVRIEAELAGIKSSWPEHVTFELHPEYGMRVTDSDGGRWLLRDGRIVARNRPLAPAWIPDLEILVLREEQVLLDWLARERIDVTRSQLARCGDADCFVLGGRGEATQLWVDKDRFEIRNHRSPRGSVAFEAYESLGRGRFPRRIRIFDRDGEIAVLEVAEASVVRLGERDFSPDWVDAR